MTIESTTRTPQEGTGRYKVFKAITEDNIPIWNTRAIAIKTGLPRKQVTTARSNLREDGLLPKPTKELTMLTKHTQAATVFPLVEEYRKLGLSLGEIQFAVKTEKGIELSDESVHSAVGYNTRVGNVRRLSEEEKHDIRRDILLLTPEEISANVMAILELRKRLLANHQTLPANRLEWKVFIKYAQSFVSFVSRGLPLPEPTDQNKEDINFANRLIANKLIGEDIGFFETLKQLYIGRQEEFENLPPEIKLRLEAFALAITQEVEQHSTDLRNKFKELGIEFGKEWFYDRNSIAAKEQKFIAGKIRTEFKTPNTPQTVIAPRTIPRTELDLYRYDDPEE